MAITMSEAKIDNSTRDELLGKEISSTANQGTGILFKKPSGGLSESEGVNLAGITPTFAKNVNTAIDTYIDAVNTALDKLSKVAQDNNNLFRGDQLVSAMNNFIEGCKDVAKSYTNKLRDAEQTIINSVETVYQTQDTDLSSNIGSDQSTVESEGF